MSRRLTRRAVVAGLTTAAGAAVAAAPKGAAPMKSDAKLPRGPRMPVVYLPHGGGPWPFIETAIGAPDELAALSGYLKAVRTAPKVAPKALLVVSAHWEEPVPTVMSSPKPPMLYDYYGFPPESYRLTWPAPGQPELAARVRALLDKEGLGSAEDPQRGFDHGTFVPLKLTWPEAEVPTVQLSLKRGLDPQEHLAMGRALAPLRDEGVFIIGSGMSYHNLRMFGPQGRPAAEAFDAWLRQAATAGQKQRDEALAAWASAPSAREAHPREEHLLPLMVVAGAARADKGVAAFTGKLLGLAISAYHYG